MKKLRKTLAALLTMSMLVGLLMSTTSAAGQSSYSDVSADASYAAAVELLTEEGIMEGIGNGRFGPEIEVSRAQAITTLARLADVDPVETDDYTDVEPDSWYSGYVGWATENGIVQGDGQGHFLPDTLVSSEHLNLMLSRYAESIDRDVAFYDTGAATVTRADLAQRLYQFFVEETSDSTVSGGTTTEIIYRDRIVEVDEAMTDSEVTLPIRAHVTSTGRAGCDPDETEEEHAAHSSEGYIMGYSDRGIYTFLGIQYGTAARFENPKPADVYNDMANLYSEDPDTPTLTMIRGAASPQAKTNTVYQDYFGFAQFMTPSGSDMYGVESECLNLNVWTDSMDSDANKPVLVFMHGGGTNSDSANGLEVYDGRGMVEHTGIVFVSVNARLGTLGYSTDLTAIGGGNNLAVRDMLLALEWVKENIATFGGDPDNVTIVGQSGGGSKVSYLIDSKYADEHNLFQKVVAISASLGSSVTAASGTYDSRVEAMADNIRTAGVGGLNQDSTDAEVLAYLQSVRTDEIDAVLSQYGNSGGFVQDGYIFDENSWFGTTDELSPRAAQYTYLIGNTWAEMVGRDSIEVIQYNQYNRAKAYLTEEEQLELLEAMRHSASGEMRGSLEELEEAFHAIFPDHDFYDLRTLVSGNLGGFTRDNYYNSSIRVGNSTTVYEYLMAYEFPYFGGTPMYHTGDLAFWFYSLGNVRYQIAGDEENAYKVADFCSTALANFCRTGNPSVDGIEWLPHEEDNAHCMIVDVNSRLVDGDYGEELIYLMEMVPTDSE